MNKEENYDQTISNSKEESILKAMQMLGERVSEEEIKRPNINLKKILFEIFSFIFFELFIIGFVIFFYQKLQEILVIFLGLILFFLIIFIYIKKLIIDFILLYQKYAPEKLRASCLFKPSCSEYMLLAIEKYGVIKGVFKGIKRLLRCHYPNGGTDYP